VDLLEGFYDLRPELLVRRLCFCLQRKRIEPFVVLPAAFSLP